MKALALLGGIALGSLAAHMALSKHASKKAAQAIREDESVPEESRENMAETVEKYNASTLDKIEVAVSLDEEDGKPREMGKDACQAIAWNNMPGTNQHLAKRITEAMNMLSCAGIGILLADSLLKKGGA